MFKPDDTAYIPVRLLEQVGEHWRVSINSEDPSEVLIPRGEMAKVMGGKNINIPFPAGSTVWVWAPSVGREPVQMVIETISIWMDKRYPDTVKFLYDYEHEPGDHKYIPDRVTPYATREEAIAFREEWKEMSFPTSKRRPWDDVADPD